MDTTKLFQDDSLTELLDGKHMEETTPLTQEQQEVHDRLLSWLTSSDIKPAIFTGYAGVGKSFTLGKFVETVKGTIPKFSSPTAYPVIGMTAPTHKAVKVLKREAFPGIDYRTLHSMLALREQIDHITGEVSYAPEKGKLDPPPITDLKLLIVDEVSMLTDDLFNFLVPWIKKGLKVLFTGDRGQIPPVKHRDCIPFLQADNWGMFQVALSTVMRQKSGNPILEFATEIRGNQKTGEFTPKQHILENGEGIQLVDHASQQELSILEKYFTDSKFKEDSDFMKVIAWRNITVSKYNDIIRGLLYKNEAHINDIMLGEKLLMDRPYIISARSILTKNEEIEVKSIQTLFKQLSYSDGFGTMGAFNAKFYNVMVKWYTDKGDKTGNILIIHEDSKAEYLKVIEILKNYALSAPADKRGKMWKQYYQMIENSAWIKYNYAVTSHTSQGSSYDHTLVLKWDIDYNKNIEERNRILYVACTRARNTLFIEV
jgi:hypothetical protein